MVSITTTSADSRNPGDRRTEHRPQHRCPIGLRRPRPGRPGNDRPHQIDYRFKEFKGSRGSSESHSKTLTHELRILEPFKPIHYDPWNGHRYCQYRTDRAPHHPMGRSLLSSVSSPKERSIAANRQARPSECFAIRFAAKEAFLKAIGLGYREGIRWTDIEVVNDSMGKPSLFFHRKAKESLSDPADPSGAPHPFPRPSLCRGPCPFGGEKR